MWIIGGGIMVTGLVAGALFAGFWVSIGIIAAGLLIVTAASWREHIKEQAANAWRAAYPPYGY